jgi:predicted restriction endonuclease
MQNDLLSMLEDTSQSATERLAEVAVRLGQGKFRAGLAQEFENACAATRLAVLPVLRASHIVPWKDSLGAQRLDPMNGLLLSANMDALFDRYMITCRLDGKLEASKSLTQNDLERLGPLEDLQSKPCDRRAAYLSMHHAEFERLEQDCLEYVRASDR